MKFSKIFIAVVIILMVNVSLNAKDNLIDYLKKLVENGYSDVAISLSYKHQDKMEIKKFLLKMLLANEKYESITKLINKNTKNLYEIKYLAEAYIFLDDTDNVEKILHRIKNLDKNLFYEVDNIYKGISFYRKYDYKNAIVYLKKVKNMSDRLKNILAKIYVFTGKYNAAESILSKTLKKDYFILALLNYHQHNYKKCLTVLNKVKDSKDSQILRFNCYLKLGKFKKSELILSKLDLLDKNNFYKKIETLFSYKKLDEIENRLKNKEDSYLKFYFLGKIYKERKDYFKSVQYFQKAITLNRNSEVLFLLASVYENMKSYKLAIPFYKEVVVMEDNDTYYYDSIFKLAYCLYKTGDFTEAVKYFNKYLNNEEGNSKYLGKAIEYLAVSYKNTGDFVNAVKIYNKLEALAKTEKDKKNINFEIANLWEKLGKYNFAVEILTKYVPVSKREDLWILKKLGDIYFKIGDFKSSNVYYIDYIDKKNGFVPGVNLKIGLNYLYQEKIEQAKKYFLTIIENEHSDKYKEEALFWIGKIFFNRKNYKLTLIYFTKLYNFNNISPLAEQAKNYICYCYYRLQDRENFLKYFKLLSNPALFIKKFNISFGDICKFTDCKKEMTLSLIEEQRFNYFDKLFESLKDKSSDYLLSIVKSNKYYGEDIIIYYYIGKIFFKKGLENKGIFAFNKFLNNGYNSLFYQEYKDALSKIILYYYAQKNFQKIIGFYPVYSHISQLPENIKFIIGYSSYQYNLNKAAKKYLSEFIETSNNGDKLFRAAFCLDKMNFLDNAKKGYLKSLKFLANEKVIIESYYWLGSIEFKKENYNEALNYFLKIKLMYPFDEKWTPTASFRVANIYEKLGKRRKAFIEYNYILKRLQDNDPRKSFVRKKIKELGMLNEAN